jgi:hypothetical protein
MKTILVGRANEPVMVDDDFAPPEGFCLSVAKTGYVRMLRYTGVRRPNGSYVYEEDYLHRWITKAPKGKAVLFIDRNRLNLQRDNLIVCDRVLHIRHTGGRTGRFKGVHYDKRRLKWVAQITCNYKCYTLGSFDCEEAAATAYNHAAVRLYGEYAYVNVMPEEMQYSAHKSMSVTDLGHENHEQR